MAEARREAEADGAAFNIAEVLGALGLATASTTITLAATCKPPPTGLAGNTYYYLAVTGTFLAGVAQAGASVWVSDDPRGRRAAGTKFLYASVAAPLVIFTVGAALVVAAASKSTKSKESITSTSGQELLTCMEISTICCDLRGP